MQSHSESIKYWKRHGNWRLMKTMIENWRVTNNNTRLDNNERRYIKITNAKLYENIKH